MIRALSQCRYCPTHIAYDWPQKVLVFNPDTGFPVCDHVVYIHGSHLAPQDTYQESSILFRWFHPNFSELNSNERLLQYLSDIQEPACGKTPGWEHEYELGAVWTWDMTTIEEPRGLLDVFLIYALDPGSFLEGCLRDIERSQLPIPERWPSL
jgi:hypothetical protein